MAVDKFGNTIDDDYVEQQDEELFEIGKEITTTMKYLQETLKPKKTVSFQVEDEEDAKREFEEGGGLPAQPTSLP